MWKALGTTALVAVLAVVVISAVNSDFRGEVAVAKNQFVASVLPSVLITLTNQERAQEGVGQLVESPLLDEAAQMKANDEASKGYFAHVSPDGTPPWYWINKAGYDYVYAGENLAVNFDDSTAVEDAWINSPTHFANIVKPQYTNIGIAVAQGLYQGKETTFVVQYFASPASGFVPSSVASTTATSSLAAAVVLSNVSHEVTALFAWILERLMTA